VKIIFIINFITIYANYFLVTADFHNRFVVDSVILG